MQIATETLRSTVRLLFFTLLLLLILPLYLSAVALRLLRSTPPERRPRMCRLPVLLALASSLLVLLLSALPLHGDDAAPMDRASAVSESDELRARIARLESVLEGHMEMMSSKMSHLNEKIRLIEQLDIKIQNLQDSLENLKRPPKDYNQAMASDVEEEIRLLWAKMRESNFDLYFLETKVEDSESRFKSTDSQLQELKDIVTEQWIQIRHLEQALQIAKIRHSKSQKAKVTRCIFQKFFEDLNQKHFWKSPKQKTSLLPCFVSRIFDRIKKLVSHVQSYHHALQLSVKEMLENNGNVPTYANKEVAFFLASSIILLPVLPIILLFVTFFNR